MDALPYLLPWFLLLLTAGVAVAVKFLNIKSIAGIAVVSTLSVLMIALAIYANIISSQQVDRVEEKQAELDTMETWKYQHLDEMALIIAQMRPPSDEALALITKLVSYGWKLDNPKLSQPSLADTALARVKSEWEADKPVLIKGIPNMVDYEIVNLSLRQAGFTVIPYREDEKPEEQANILYFGRDVSILETKMAALILMRAGVDLKAVKPFPKVTKGNVRALKIEWNKYYLNRQPLAVGDVETAEIFK